MFQDRFGSWRTRWGAVAWLLAGALLLDWAVERAQERQRRNDGEAIYLGRTDLAGTLPGHSTSLPTLATRCSNCHEAQSPALGASAPAAAYATSLTAATLARLSARRGGPPSRFDASSLCALLRTGIDPAQVMIATTMPRYAPTEQQCTSLWAYLSTR